MKQTIQIFARVKPTVRKQQQGVRVGAARAPARRGLPDRGRGGTRGAWAGVSGSAPGAGCGPELSTLGHGARAASQTPAHCGQGRGQTDTQYTPTQPSPAGPD